MTASRSDEIDDQVSAQLFVEARRGRSAALRSYVGYLGGSIGPEMVFEGTLEGRIGEAPGVFAVVLCCVRAI
eukprot:2121734-Rhodomonas_salina.2